MTHFLPSSRFLALVAAVFAAGACLLAPSHAQATAYWTTLSGPGDIANGVNGFSTIRSGGSWSQYGNVCETMVSSYPAGSYCKFRFNVPGGTTAMEGIARGQYSIANTNFVLRSERPGGNPSYVLDGTTKGAFGHGFGGLGGFFDLGFFVKAATSMSGAFNWMHIDTFEVKLDDPSIPVLAALSFPGATAGGWYGPGCVAGQYGWADSGSQMWSTSLTNLSTSQVVHSWGANPGRAVVVSGLPSVVHATCIPVAGSGVQSFRTTAYDRAGNGANHDFALKFDTTPPLAGNPTLAAQPLGNGTVIAGSIGYRPSVSWPEISDAHSGVASVTASIDGAPLALTMAGSTATLALGSNLPLGNHTLRLRVTDAVGNATNVDRSISVVDDVAPSFTLTSPQANGSSDPVLDVTASDDSSGLNVSTWTVLVDGQVLVAGSTTNRLQAAIGLLADGTHSVQVSIKDNAGNVGTHTFSYVADSGPDVPQLPEDFLTGIYVFDPPTTSTPGQTHRLKAVMVKNGRPVTGRAEIREGTDTIASKELEPNGTVDMAITINKVHSQLTYHGPAGVGLEPRIVEISCVACGGGDITKPTPHVDPPVAKAEAIPCSFAVTACGGSYPANMIYYVGTIPMWNGVPLAESGAALDRVSPTWTVTLVQQKAGVFKRTRKITLRLWTSEFSVVSVMPIGAKNRTTISPRRTARTIQVLVDKNTKLGTLLRSARAGKTIPVKLRIVAADRNDNRSAPKIVMFRIRV